MADHVTVYATSHGMPPVEAWRGLAPDAEVAQAGASVRIAWPEATVRITRMSDEQMGEHLHELLGYIRQRGGAEGLAIRALGTRSVFGIAIEPGLDRAVRAGLLVTELTAATDGVWLRDGELLDEHGARLLDGVTRPDAARVARRARVLLAAAVGGTLDPDATAEAEPEELADGRVEGAEGALVLLWALGAGAMPPFDHPAQPAALWRDLGAAPLLAAPALRDPAEVEALRRRLLAIHWRLVEQRVHPGRVDFRGFARTAWFGGFELADLPLVDDDLAIGDTAISQVPPPALRIASSIAIERHRAANWLIGAHPIYSKVATPT